MKTFSPICCVAGKSGGHIIPCLQFAVSQYLSKSSVPLLFISTSSALDQKIKTQFPLINNHLALDLENVPYQKWWRLPLFGFSFIKAFWTSFWYLKKHKPSRIISTGGFITLPVCFAAKLLRIPIDLFELNVIPGKATALVSKFATNLFVCFKEAKNYFPRPSTFTEYPLRFTKADKKFSREKVLHFLGFIPTKKVLLILGGSQGSQFLNRIIQKAPIALLNQYQIIHQTGTAEVEQCTEFYQAHNITAQVFAYQSNLVPYYQIADHVICRAGAGTLFELLFFEKQCTVIPLETFSTDHQVDNAYAMHKAHPNLFRVLRQKDLLPNTDRLFTAIQ